MWGRLKQWMTADTEQLTSETLEFLDLWQLAITDPGVLTVKPTSTRLRARNMLDFRERLRNDGPDDFQEIRFDFSSVEEFTGPWAIHFAVLIDLLRKSHGRVFVTGLRSKPARMAWLLRHSQEIRELFADDLNCNEREAA
jgi:hypothetical protein